MAKMKDGSAPHSPTLAPTGSLTNAKRLKIQDEFSRRAQESTRKLGDLKAKHRIPDEDWAEIAEHHNEIIRIGQEALDSTKAKAKKK
jgi:hypothetical protein